MSLFQTNFTTLDWGIVVTYLLGSIAIGVWANRYVGNLSDYLVAGRTLRVRLALATMTGTELGLVTIMYMSELGYKQQYASLYLALLEALSFFAVGATGFLVYRLRQTAVLTVPEFYEQRYSRGVRVLGGTMMVISGVLNMGLFLKAGSMFVTAVTGMSDPEHLKWMMTALLLLVLLYTVLGGMVSVVITDLIQFLVLGTGMLIVTGMVVYNISFEGFADVVTKHNGYFDPTDSHNRSAADGSGGIGLLGVFKMGVVVFAASMLWPTSVARTLSVKSPEVAQKLYLFSTIPLLARRALPIVWGIGAFAFFHANSELGGALATAVDDAESGITILSATPLYLAKIIPTGLLGLVTAGMIAAFMSTHDSYLLCWSGVVTQDIVAPLFGPLSQRTRILITRIAIVAIGAVLLTWGLWYELSSDLWNYMTITGTVYLAGALPVAIGGLYWKRSSTAGAYAALLGGLCGLLSMGPVLNRIRSWPSVESFEQSLRFELTADHVTLLTFVVSLGGFVAGSLLFPSRAAADATDDNSTGDAS